MPGIDLDVMCHKLSIDTRVKLVVQLRRKMGYENRRVVIQEVEKLIGVDM